MARLKSDNTDSDSSDHADHTYCYAVSQRFASSGNGSQHSPPVCWWGPQSERVQTYSAYKLSGEATWSTWGRPHLEDWGWTDQELAVETVVARRSGPHLIQVVYANAHGPISTGITTGSKEIVVIDRSSEIEVGRGGVAMPHMVDWDTWGESTLLRVNLTAGHTYRLVLRDHQNMTGFDHFALYTGGMGGGSEPWNRFDVAEVKVLPIDGVETHPLTAPAIALDGLDDFDKFSASSSLAVGAPLQPWDAFALTWDKDNLYVAVVSEAFEDSWTPFLLYLDTSEGPISPSWGMEYSGFVPELPFEPSYAVVGRQQSDDGTASGPYNGLWRRDGATWIQQERGEPNVDEWLSSDLHTRSFTVSRHAIGDPDTLRMAGHIVYAVPANEWKDLIPAAHTPWAAGGGAHVRVDLTGPSDASSWEIID